MLPNDKEYLVRKEHFQDLQREAEQTGLAGSGQLLQPRRRFRLHLKLIGWMGDQLIHWGLKLQQDKGTQEKI
jgi:hypothetical protein